MGGSSRRRTTGGTAPLQHLLEGTLAGLDMGAQVKEQAALRAWEQIAGRVVGAHARAEAMRDGVLVVATDTPAWAQELHMRQSELLSRLRPLLGDGAIKEIRFRSGLRKQREKAPAGEETPAGEPLSGRRLGELRKAAAGIDDSALRQRVEHAFASLARIAEWRRRRGWRQCARCGQWQRTGKRWCASCTYGRGRQ